MRTFTDRHGLKYLLNDLVSVDVSKQQQTSDWGAEVLTEAQLDYAASDVLYLHRLRSELDARLAREGRTEGDTLSDTMLIPGVVMRWLFPFIILLAVHLFLRGHDLPGGGFAAGVALSIAFILQYMSSGARWVEERLEILRVERAKCRRALATL